MHNAIMSLDDLFDEVTDLWPRFKTTKSELQTVIWHRVQRYSGTDRFNAIRKHRFDFPDDRAPKWSAILKLLSEKAHEVNRCEFQTMLDHIRRDWRQSGHTREAEDRSDEQVWDSHLQWLAFPITHHSNTQKARADEKPCTICAGLAEKLPDLRFTSETPGKEGQPFFEPCNLMAIECKARRAQRYEYERWLAYFADQEREAPMFLRR